MRKIIMLVFVFLLTLTSFSNITNAKIIVEDDFNDSIAFYFWENRGIGKGVIVSYVKYIDKNNNERYWLRLDLGRTEKLLQYATLAIAGKPYQLEQVDNFSQMYIRIGVSKRVTPYYSFNKAFFDLPLEVVNTINESSEPIFLTFHFQYGKTYQIEMSTADIAEFKTLTTLNRSHYQTYFNTFKE